MSEWRESTLGDVAEVAWGDTSITKAAYVDDGVVAFSASGPDGFLPSAHQSGDGVVISAIGAQCGKTWFAQGAWCCIKNTLWFQAHDGVSTRFLFYATSDRGIWPKRGAAQPFISLSDAKMVQLHLPPLATQELISDILGGLDDLINNNRRRIELLEQMAQAIHREWFVYFRYPGHEDSTLIDSPLGPIPEGWNMRPLDSIAALDRTGVQPRQSPDELFDHYSIPAFDQSQLPITQAGREIRSGKFLLTGPGVLVSKLNPRIERTWLVDPVEAKRSVASTEFLIIRPRPGFSLEFIYLLARSVLFQERLRELSGGTSTSHQRAKPNDFLQIEVVEPPAGATDRLAEVVRPQLRLARTLRLKSHNLAALRDLLLPKLVTGRIDVSSLDLDAVVESVA